MEDVVKEVTPENYHDMTFEPIETPKTSVEPNNVEIVSEPELKTEELPKSDEPKEVFDETAKHFQSIADKRLAELTKLTLEKERLETELNSVKSPKPEAKPEIIEPVEPAMPPDYDPIDAVTKGTTSYEYDKQLKQYLKDVAKYNLGLTKEFKQEKEIYERANQQSQLKAQILGEYTTRGKSVTEAEELYNFTADLLSPKGFTPERIMAFYEFEKKNSPQNQLKNSQMDSRNEKQKYVTPPGVIPSQTDKSKNADELFDEQIKNPKRGWL